MRRRYGRGNDGQDNWHRFDRAVKKKDSLVMARFVIPLGAFLLVVILLIATNWFSSGGKEEHYGNRKRSPVCASLDASEDGLIFRHKGIDYDATYFEGGFDWDEEYYQTWNWPYNLFAESLEEAGWSSVQDGDNLNLEDCPRATFKIFAADISTPDGEVFRKYCRTRNTTQSKSLAFGFDEVYREFSDKDRFNHNIQEYETSKGYKKSLIPLTFSMRREAECKAFFAMQQIEPMSWLAKEPDGTGGNGIDYISNFSAFREQLSDCRSTTTGPIVQEVIKPRLIEGKTWNFRTYVFIVNLKPLRVLRRLGHFKICSELYSRRHNADPLVRARALKCNKHIAQTHPLWDQEGGPSSETVMRSFEELEPILGETHYKRFLEDMDAATETVLRAMEPHMSADTATTDHSVGLYCIDGILTDDDVVKMIDYNTRCGPPRFETDEAAQAQIALTAFRQFGLSDSNFDVDACIKEIPDYVSLM